MDLKKHINQLRHDFHRESLDKKDVSQDPVQQFERWFGEAVAARVNEPNAMGLSTVSPEGKPSSRIVLLRNFSEAGFTFYTNYRSRKGAEIDENPNACLLFFWPELERQVRVEGELSRLSAEESDEYFRGRPRLSKLGAWTSPQSSEINDRTVLDKELEILSGKYPGEDIPRPPHWGGYLLHPLAMEFWQGRPGRLHDRIMYVKAGHAWKISRLAP